MKGQSLIESIVAGARRLAAELESGVIVVIIPDRGDRYLSTNLFKSMCAQCPPLTGSSAKG